MNAFTQFRSVGGVRLWAGLCRVVLAVACAIGTAGCARSGGGGGGVDGNANANDNAADDGAPANFVEVPAPLSGDNPTYPLQAAEVPEPGEGVTDTRLGTTQTRVVQTEGLRHEYSRHDPFNVDQSMIVLRYFSEGEWRVYRTQGVPYDQEANLVTTLDMEEPRWDPDDPDVIWGLRDFLVVTVNVRSGQTTTVKDFAQDATIGPILAANPDLYRVTMKDEGEPCKTKRFWALLLQGSNEDYRVRYILTWDRLNDAILGRYTIEADQADIDWVGMSVNGNWVLIGGSEANNGDLAGLVMADKELTQFHRLDYATAHADVGLDSDGNEVIVMQGIRTDYIDMIPLDLNTQPIPEGSDSYDNTGRTPLMRLFYASESPQGLNSGVHISCNVPGWCVVSTTTEPDLPEQNWLDRTITLVRLDADRPRVFYLAKVYGTTATGAFWEETHAAITNDGARVIWATNWNQNVGDERVWNVELDLPAGWMTTLTLNDQP